MDNHQEALKEALQGFSDADLKYMIVGSVAMGFYAPGRNTQDVDIVIHLTAADLRVLMGLFARDWYVEESTVAEAIARKSVFNVVHQRLGTKLDLIVCKTADFELMKFKRRQAKKLDGLTIWVQSAEDCVLSKMEWHKKGGSERQLEDVQSIIRQHKDLDWGYIEYWAGELGLRKILKKVRP